MTERDVSDYDMPSSHRALRQAVSEIQGTTRSALLAATVLSDDPAPVQQLADVVAALRLAPASDELAAKGAALAEFCDRIGVSARSNRSRRRRPTLLTSLLSAKAAAAVAIAALGIGGVATAAYAGKLPTSAQQFAHDTIGAPAAHHGHHHGRAAGQAGQPVGPNAAGHAAYGLCTAYGHASAHGSAAQKSVAFRNLVKAAGGADKVAAYCKAVPHPGASQSRSSHLTGKRTSHPTHRTGKPTSHPTHPTGKPTALPSTQPSGRGTAGGL